MDEMRPRAYQTELEDLSLRENAILYLPTGSGKTFIAIRVIRRLQKAVAAPFSTGGKRSFFLVNTVPLVYQHTKIIENLTSLSVRAFSGQDNVDLWNHTAWTGILEETQVLVMTAQILLDMLLHGYIQIENINLMIFDECHSAVDKHPMRQIMARFQDAEPQKRPRILGLTATLINKNIKPSDVADTIRTLESTFHAKIVTSSNLEEVLSYSTNPFETVVRYDDAVARDNCITQVTETLRNFIKVLECIQLENVLPPPKPGYVNIITSTSVPKKLSRIKDSIVRTIEDMGILGGSLSLMCAIVKLERLKLKADRECHPMLQQFITVANKCRGIFEKRMGSISNTEKIYKFCSPKVLLLLNILKEYSNNSNVTEKRINKQDKPICGIIFVKERQTSLILYTLLKFVKQTLPDDFEFLKHDFITGFNCNPYTDTREDLYTKKMNQQVITKFTCGLLNCLISTDILEEGFDLPQCNLVVRFDRLLTVRSYVQSKGRGRQADASYVIMCPKSESEKFHTSYITFTEVNNELERILQDNTDIRIPPSNEESADSFNDNELYSYNNAKITLNSAMSVLYRYCANLPHDIFTSPQPRWMQRKSTALEEKLVTIEMPVNCPMKIVAQGRDPKNLKTAKQRAALEACKMLHKMGELNDSLLPCNKAESVLDDSNNKKIFPHLELLANRSKLSNEKKIKPFDKKLPICYQRNDQNKSSFFLYTIKIKPINLSDNRDINEIYKIIESPRGIGVITSKEMHRLCPFTLFNTSGEFTIYVEPRGRFHLNENQLELVKKFELIVLMDVLNMKQTFTTFDETNPNNYLFIVPTDGSNIDWKFLDECKPIEEVEGPSDEKRQCLDVTEEDYLHHILTPWYRCDYDCRYIVIEVCHHLSPSSPFPNEQFQSFAHYYQVKYGCKIECKNPQPLLKVKAIGGNKMNCLLPRKVVGEVNLSKRKLRSLQGSADDTTHEFVLFIPEFCQQFSFPGVLWLKATMLPSILHRITMLLQAEDFRREIATATQIGCVDYPKDFALEPLDVDFHATKKTQESALSGNINNHAPPPPEDSSENSSPVHSINHTKNSLNVSYEIAKKNLDEEYPWKSELEPLDIYRNIDTINVMHIDCYENFVNEKVNHTIASPKKVKENVVIPRFSSRAICAPPFKYDSTIKIIEKQPNAFGPQMKHIVAALTLARTNDVFNLERFEILGDSFLKYATSFFLWKQYPKYNEGQLTALKCQIISNNNLQICGELKELPGRMKVKQFVSQSDWMPPGLHTPKHILEWIIKQAIPNTLNSIFLPREEMISGVLSNNSINYVDETFEMSMGMKDFECVEAYVGKQSVRNKEIADSVEALIGVYILDGGIMNGFKMLDWLRILPTKETVLDLFSDKTNIKQSTNIENIDFLLNYNRNKIEEILGYKFKDPSLLLQALSHASNVNNRITECYQRLEFLGDAVLDFLVTCYIYEQFDTLSPGDITDLRSALVNNVTFACMVVRLGLHKYLLSSNSLLDSSIFKFVNYQNQRKHVIDETVLFLLEEDNCTIANYVDVPKVLGDIFESLAGAIFIDSGNNLQTTWNIYYKFMCEEILQFSENIPKQPVRLIYERIHAAPKFFKSSVTATGRVMVPLKINVNGKTRIFHGFGVNRADAKRSAAKIALKILND